MPGGGRAVKTGRTRPCPMPLGSRDGMSKAPAIYCRGRADEVRGDEATYLSMTVRHGHSRRARRPLATASLFSAAPPRPAAGRMPWFCWSPALSQSATLTSGPARCTRRARHWRRSAPLCRQHTVLAYRHGRNKLFQIQSKKHGLWPCFLLWIRQLPIFPCRRQHSIFGV